MKLFHLLLLCIFLTSCGSEPKEIPAYTKDFCQQIHFGDSATLSNELLPLQNYLNTNKTGVYVLEDGGNAMMTRAWLSEHAEKTIDIQYFIFATDNVGLIACDYLVRAADHGIKVRILIDDIMVDAGPHEILALDAHPNIEIKIYNPGINLGKNIAGKLTKLATNFKGANQRMHNKTFCVDGKVVITGGRNIADEYFDFDHEFNFRDRDVLLLGNIVKEVQNSFETFWNHELSLPITQLVEDPNFNPNDTNLYERLHQYACNPENFWPQVREKIKALPEMFKTIIENNKLVWIDSVAFISDAPGKNEVAGMHGGGNTTQHLAELIRNAQHRIDIQSPYLILTEEGLRLFAATVQRGVQINIMTNSLASNDNLAAFAGYQKVRKTLLQAGVNIYEFRPEAKERYEIMTGALQQKMNFTPIFGLHAKTMVIDGHITVIGTFNLDPRSANFNTECVTVMHSAQIAAGVLKGIEQEYQPENSWHTTLTFNPDAAASKWTRLKTYTKRALPMNIL